MLKTRFVITTFSLAGLLVSGIISGTGAYAFDGSNGCVRCHTALASNSFVGAKSHNWEGSIHQEHGITCDKCHGGDPTTLNEKLAHVGVFGSSSPDSTVYFKNIPRTCGKCHGAELYKFTQSYHYKKLESSGQGPNCVTCHGSMVTTVLKPDDLAGVCERCHNSRLGVYTYVPEKAKTVLLLLAASKSLIGADGKLYTSKGDQKLLQAAQRNISAARLAWHTFDLDSIVSSLQAAYDSLNQLSAPERAAAKSPANKK